MTTNVLERLKGAMGTLVNSPTDKIEYVSLPEPQPTRDVYKALIPGFLYKPPFGYPRYLDVPEMRRLANTPFVDVCVDTIINEATSVKWDIVPKEEHAKSEKAQKNTKIVKMFFDNPNRNKESFKYILRKALRDILVLESGAINKIFSNEGYLSQILAIDGGTVTLNHDIYGSMDGKSEILPPTWKYAWFQNYVNKSNDTLYTMSHKAAYFQYGWNLGARPQPFGLREIMYLTTKPRTSSIYPLSRMEVIYDTVQALVYGIDHNLDYFKDNNIPKGVNVLKEASPEAVKEFTKQLSQSLMKKDEFGTWKKRSWYVPTTGYDFDFKRMQFSNQELELITSQQWFSKLVWSEFGVTPSELGFTEDTNRATSVSQKNVMRRRTIRPILDVLEYHINKELISEFKIGVLVRETDDPNEKPMLVKGIDDVEFKFDRFEVDEAIEKTQLYEIQLRNGIRTKNEIRVEEGLEPLEGGDELQNTGNPFNQSDDDNDKDKEKKETTDKKFTDDNKKNDKEGKKETKSEKEEPEDLSKLEEVGTLYDAMKIRIDSAEKEIISVINREKKESKITEMKALPFAERLKDMLNLEGVFNLAKRFVSDSFLKGYEKAEIELNMNFNRPDMKAAGFLGQHALERVKDMEEEVKNKLRAELERGFINGEGITKLKARIKKVMDMADSRAEAIARTETARAEIKGRLDGYKDSGIKGKVKWKATIDDRTSDICRHLNDKTVDVGKNFSYKDFDGQGPPAHVNCRSVVTFVPE